VEKEEKIGEEMEKKHCFIEVKRSCTIKCKSAYKSKGEIYCSILWSIKQFGYALTKPIKCNKKK